MNDDICENCYWYWTGVGGYECHHFPRPIYYDDMHPTACGYFEQMKDGE